MTAHVRGLFASRYGPATASEPGHSLLTHEVRCAEAGEPVSDLDAEKLTTMVFCATLQRERFRGALPHFTPLAAPFRD